MDEFIYMCRGMAVWKVFRLQVSKTLSPSQIKAVFEKFDSNQDGRLSKKEFKKLMGRE